MALSYSAQLGTPPSYVQDELLDAWLGERTNYLIDYCTTPTRSVTYYASTAGNDANDGLTISTPVATTTKINALLAAAPAGGARVLLRRGDIWRTSIGINLGGIAFNAVGAYGAGVRPILTTAINTDFNTGSMTLDGASGAYSVTVTSDVATAYHTGNVWDWQHVFTVMSSIAAVKAATGLNCWFWDSGTNKLWIKFADAYPGRIEVIPKNTSDDGIELSADDQWADSIVCIGWGVDPANPASQRYNIRVSTTGTDAACVTNCGCAFGTGHIAGQYSGFDTAGGIALFADCDFAWMRSSGLGTHLNFHSGLGGHEAYAINPRFVAGEIPTSAGVPQSVMIGCHTNSGTVSLYAVIGAKVCANPYQGTYFGAGQNFPAFNAQVDPQNCRAWMIDIDYPAWTAAGTSLTPPSTVFGNLPWAANLAVVRGSSCVTKSDAYNGGERDGLGNTGSIHGAVYKHRLTLDVMRCTVISGQARIGFTAESGNADASTATFDNSLFVWKAQTGVCAFGWNVNAYFGDGTPVKIKIRNSIVANLCPRGTGTTNYVYNFQLAAYNAAGYLDHNAYFKASNDGTEPMTGATGYDTDPAYKVIQFPPLMDRISKASGFYRAGVRLLGQESDPYPPSIGPFKTPDEDPVPFTRDLADLIRTRPTAVDLASAVLVTPANKLATDAVGGVSLAAVQPAYAPAKLNDAMALTVGERSTLAAAIEAAMVNDGDATALLQAIADKVATENVSLAALGTSIRDLILNRVIAGNYELTGSVGKLLQYLDASLASRASQTSLDTAAVNAVTAANQSTAANTALGLIAAGTTVVRANDASGAAVATAATVAAVKTKTDLIGSGVLSSAEHDKLMSIDPVLATVASPLNETGDLTLVEGDDYLVTPLAFTLTSAVDLSTADCELAFQTLEAYDDDVSTVLLTKTGSIIVDGDTTTLSFALSHSDIAALPTTPPGDDLPLVYQVRVSGSGIDTRTTHLGAARVKRQVFG